MKSGYTALSWYLAQETCHATWQPAQHFSHMPTEYTTANS